MHGEASFRRRWHRKPLPPLAAPRPCAMGCPRGAPRHLEARVRQARGADATEGARQALDPGARVLGHLAGVQVVALVLQHLRPAILHGEAVLGAVSRSAAVPWSWGRAARRVAKRRFCARRYAIANPSRASHNLPLTRAVPLQCSTSSVPANTMILPSQVR